MTQAEHYEQFLALHQQPEAFVMPNAWDGLSALILKNAGFAALGTSSVRWPPRWVAATGVTP
jgi:2-methylisocitrate lyase-like PEP mutase family enzyme